MGAEASLLVLPAPSASADTSASPCDQLMGDPNQFRPSIQGSDGLCIPRTSITKRSGAVPNGVLGVYGAAATTDLACRGPWPGGESRTVR